MSADSSPLRIILHVDMDAFFASVEQREEPRYKGKPVIVGADPQGGRGRGVVAACSYEARQYGVHSALPIGRAYRLCPHAVFLRPNGALYSEVSSAVMEILGRFTDRVEPISIDEAFLDVTGCVRLFGDARRIGEHIKEAIRREQDLSCSIGVARNKFLAKIASDLNKPDGYLEVEPGSEIDFLKDLPVRRIWGVGPRTEEKLHGIGVRTIGDVTARSKSFWAAALGRHGEHLWNLGHGTDDRPVRSGEGFKSLSHEHTFLHDVDDLETIGETLLSLSEAVARRARKHKLAAGTVVLKWRNADFSTKTRQRRLDTPSHDARQIYPVVRRLTQEFLPLRQKVRLLGVGLSRFVESEDLQPDLFDAQTKRKTQLDESVDQIRKKFGRGIIRPARLVDKAERETFTSFLKK